jgi:hypothetical protein
MCGVNKEENEVKVSSEKSKDISNIFSGKSKSAKRSDEVVELYDKLGRPAINSYKDMIKNGVVVGTDVSVQDINNSQHLLDRDGARAFATIHDKTAKSSVTPSVSNIGELVNADIIFDDYGGTYLYTEDRYSKLKTVTFMKSKNGTEVLSSLTNVISLYLGYGNTVKQILTDNEVVFRSCSYPMMRQQVIMHYTPSGSHNKIIERAVRSLKEKVLVIKASMSYKLPPDLEHFALEHAVYLLNRYPNNHTFPTSSWEIFSGEKFNMKYIHLLPFGSVAIFFQGNDLRTKEHPYRGEYGIFVGKHANMPTSLRVFLPSRNEIVDRSNNYQLLSSPPVEWNYESNPYRSIKSKSKKVKISINNDTNDATLTVINDDEVLKIDKIDANVEEDAISSSNIEDNEIVEQDVGDLSKVVSVDKMSVISQSEMKIDNSQPILDNVTNFENINEHYEGIDGKSGRTGNTRYELRSRGTRKAFITATQLFDPGGFKSYELKDELNENYYNSSLILKTYVKQALSTSNPNRESAEISIRKELSQMVDLKVFQPVRFQDIPYGDRNKIISSIMFIKDKFKTDGTYDKTKARLAAQGDQMENSFDEIFTSPTANLISLFILLSISANNSCTIRTIDVPGAYLHASLSEEDVVYMTIPADCEDIYCDIIKREKKDIMHNGKIYVKLKKALYGLKQSSKLWYEVLKSDLLSQGFRVTNSDPCLFAKNISGKFCYALIYVDDIFITSTDISLVDSLQQYMEKQYGKVSFQDGNKISFLALSIEISDEGKFIKINQNFISRN